MKRYGFLLSLLLLATTSSAQNFPALPSGTSWIAWKVPISSGVKICCWNGKGSGCCGSCTLDDSQGFSTTDDPDVTSSGEMTIMAKVSGGKVVRVRSFDGACSVDTRGNQVQWLNVSVDASLSFLAQHLDDVGKEGSVMGVIAHHDSPRVVPLLKQWAGRGTPSETRKHAIFWLGVRGGERGFQYLRTLVRADDESREIRKRAVFAISQSKVPAAQAELIDLARHDKSRETRREAIFWLGQKAGEKAAGELRRAVDEDPDEDVREHAVFAISQLPRERGIPILADLARTHKSAAVRKKASFWLAQTGDERALQVIEEILTK